MENYLVKAHLTFISSDGLSLKWLISLQDFFCSLRSDCLRILLLCASPFNRFTLFLREGKSKAGLASIEEATNFRSAYPLSNVFTSRISGRSGLRRISETGGLSEFGVSWFGLPPSNFAVFGG